MTDDEIINMAREAGYGWSSADMHFPALQRFAKLVAAKEREAWGRPVAYRCWNNPKNADGTFDSLRIWVAVKPEGDGNEPLYTTPPQAKELNT